MLHLSFDQTYLIVSPARVCRETHCRSPNKVLGCWFDIHVTLVIGWTNWTNLQCCYFCYCKYCLRNEWPGDIRFPLKYFLFPQIPTGTKNMAGAAGAARSQHQISEQANSFLQKNIFTEFCCRTLKWWHKELVGTLMFTRIHIWTRPCRIINFVILFSCRSNLLVVLYHNVVRNVCWFIN